MRKILAIMAAFIVACSFSGCGLTNLESGNSISENQSDSSEDTNKIYTIDEICQRADEEKRFASEHSDEVFTVVGTIDRISYKSVYFESNVDKSTYSKYQLKCEFDDKDKIKDLSQNDTVTISGKLYHLIISEVTLKDCTLVSVENSDDTSEDTSSTSTSSEENTSSSTENQSTEGSAQNSSASSESSSDISEPESSDVESSSRSTSETISEPPQSSTETVPQIPVPPAETPPSSTTAENHFNDYSNPEQQNTTEYVLNTHTLKVHFASCNDVAKIKPENYATTTDLQSAINGGYTACGHCHPF